MSQVTVIGGGVTGLTTALVLKRAGHDVTVIARDYMAGTTSWVATAIWHLFWVEIDDRVKRWSVSSLDELIRLAANPASGVTLVRGIECVREQSSEAEEFLEGRTGELWKHIVPSYEPLTRDALLGRLPADYPTDTLLGGYVIEVPIADMSVYLKFLDDLLEELGVRRDLVTIESWADARRVAPAEWYVNCTGLASRHLANDDSLIPIKGQIARVSRSESVTEYIADDYSPRGMTYILPRGTDVVLGGSQDEGVDDPSVDPALGEAILKRCTALLPDLAGATVLEHMAGLRPYRPSIRLEVDGQERDLIHNYGHGGSGVSLSWGCAQEVAQLVANSELVPAGGSI